MPNRKVTICIVSKNSRHNLPECLHSLISQKYPKNLMKLIFIDDNSSDSSIGYIKEKFSQIKVISNKESIGYAAIASQGRFFAKKYNSDYLIIVSSDCVLGSDWLLKIIGMMEKNKKIAAAGSKIVKDKVGYYGGNINIAGIPHLNKSLKTKKSSLAEAFYIPKEAMALRMQAIEKIGFFDNRFLDFAPEVDFCWRLRLAGYKVAIDPSAAAVLKDSYCKKDFFHAEKNRLKMLLQNYRLITLVLFSPLLVFLEICLIIESLAKGYFKQKILSYLWIVSRMGTILHHRIKIQFKIRKIGDLKALS